MYTTTYTTTDTVNQKVSITVTITQNCAINYILLTHSKTLDSHNNTRTLHVIKNGVALLVVTVRGARLLNPLFLQCFER